MNRKSVERIASRAFVRSPGPVNRGDLEGTIWAMLDKKGLGTDELALKKLMRFVDEYFVSREYAVNDSCDYVHIRFPELGWIVLGKWGEEYLIKSPVNYVVQFLKENQAKQSKDPSYQPQRKARIRQSLDEGVLPLAFSPIRFDLYLENPCILMTDGLNRLAVFQERGEQWINSSMTYYWNIRDNRPPSDKFWEAIDFVDKLNSGLPERGSKIKK